MVHSGPTEAGPIINITTTYWPVDPPHPLNDANILYGIYDNGVVEKECCIVKNFSKTGVSQHNKFDSRMQDEFASRMQEKGFSNLCLEVYAYDKPNDTLICERFESTLMSWTKQVLETPRKRDIWKEKDNSISGRSLLRALFAFLMVYAPHHYHPDLLNSVYIIAENKVKFLSKVKVLRRPAACKKNLSEILRFIYGISVGDIQQVSKKIGDPEFPESLPDSAHIPKSLQNLYKYLQSYNPYKHSARFFFDPPFLHKWYDRIHYVHDVYMEAFCYNPSIKTELSRIIKWGSWEKSLSKKDDVLKDNEEFRNSKMDAARGNMFYKPHELNVGMIKYFVNIFKHLHSDLPHTQKVRVSDVPSASAPNPIPPNPIPVDTLESIIEERLNVSGYVYMAVNQYLKTYPQEVAGFSERILTWRPLGL